eukprot:4775351-Prymnesium_polylepis.1
MSGVHVCPGSRVRPGQRFERGKVRSPRTYGWSAGHVRVPRPLCTISQSPCRCEIVWRGFGHVRSRTVPGRDCLSRSKGGQDGVGDADSNRETVAKRARTTRASCAKARNVCVLSWVTHSRKPKRARGTTRREKCAKPCANFRANAANRV